MTNEATPEISTVPEPASVPDKADLPVSETAERFLRAITDHIPASHIEELHLFSPLRQGTVETGIAVVAAQEPANVEEDSVAGDTSAVEASAAGELAVGASTVGASTVGASTVDRHTVYTARYRHVIKGPDRGKWETDVVVEADAPLLTVEEVVRGVQRRAGEDSDIVRYSSHHISRILRIELVS